MKKLLEIIDIVPKIPRLVLLGAGLVLGLGLTLPAKAQEGPLVSVNGEAFSPLSRHPELAQLLAANYYPSEAILSQPFGDNSPLPGFAAVAASEGLAALQEPLADLKEDEGWPPSYAQGWLAPLRPRLADDLLDHRLSNLATAQRLAEVSAPETLSARLRLSLDQLPSDSPETATLRSGRLSARMLARRGATEGGSLGQLVSLDQYGTTPPPETGQDPTLEREQNAGYVFLSWVAGSLGFTIGGGYARTQLAAGSGASPASSGGMSLSSVGGGGSESGSGAAANGGSPFDSVGRFSAFMALPYQITQRIGLTPELSFTHGEGPANPDKNGNEWVMGLNFSFGF